MQKQNEISVELKTFIKKHSNLWWWVPEEKKDQLGLNSVVEGILNYGDIEDIRQLFNLIGIKKAADRFFKQISGKRPNYSKKTINFFRLYFQRHAPGNIN